MYIVYIYMYLMYLVGGFFTILKILVNGKDYPIYYDIYIYYIFFHHFDAWDAYHFVSSYGWTYHCYAIVTLPRCH